MNVLFILVCGQRYQMCLLLLYGIAIDSCILCACSSYDGHFKYCSEGRTSQYWSVKESLVITDIQTDMLEYVTLFNNPGVDPDKLHVMLKIQAVISG